MKEAELRQHLLQRKERYMKVEASVKRLEAEVEEVSKRLQATNVRLEHAQATLKQVKCVFFFSKR